MFGEKLLSLLLFHTKHSLQIWEEILIRTLAKLIFFVNFSTENLAQRLQMDYGGKIGRQKLLLQHAGVE